MKTRYFRHLFQNENDSILQMGSVWDSSQDMQTKYMFASGSYEQNLGEKNLFRPNQQDRKRDSILEEDNDLDIVVISSLTFIIIVRVLKLVEEHPTENIFLPYFSPMERLCLAQQLPEKYIYRNRVIHYLEDPYQALKEAGAKNVYFLCRNSSSIPENINALRDGLVCEPLDPNDQKIIEKMEGKKVPVVKGGYYKQNNWIFYMGVFGPDIREIDAFMDESILTKKLKYKSDYEAMDQLVKSYEERFGKSNYTSIVLYHGPINAEPSTHSSMMIGKSFTRDMGCCPIIPKDGKTCALKCQYESDYDYLQRYKHSPEEVARMGFWHLGNVNLKKYLPEILVYFWNIIPDVRCVSLPNCGEKGFWNSQIMNSLRSNDNIYWAIAIEPGSRLDAILDIVTYQAHNRLVQLNERIGYCFSGYIVEKDEL